MNLEEYLKVKNTSVLAILKEIENHIDLSEKLVLAVGSLVEGIGNLKSDVDILVVDMGGATECHNPEIAFQSGDCLVDVQIIKQSQIFDISKRLLEWDSNSKISMFEPGFNEKEIKLLHRIANCYPLKSSIDINELFKLSPGLVSRLKFYIAFHLAKTIQVDLVGFHEDDDLYGLVYSAQRYFGLSLDMLLASYSISNPNPKWRGKLLRQLAPEIILEIEALIGCKDIISFSYEIFSQLSIQSVDKFFQAVDIVNKARMLISYAKQVLDNSGAVIPRQADGNLTAKVLPSLKMDVFIDEAAEAITIGRLNEFSSVVTLTEPYRAAIYMFDGRSRIADVLVKYSTCGLDETRIQDLQFMLERQGFIYI